MYVLVRKDLDPSYRMVQGAHALAQYMIDYKSNDWNNQTLVFVTVENENELKLYEQKLLMHGKQFSKFYEPDIGNQFTSIACYDDGRIFRNLKLA